MEKIPQKEAIQELTLALLYMLRFNDNIGSRFNELSWKGYDHDTLHILDEKDWIVEGGRKYVYLTAEGRRAAREILSKYGIEDDPLYERFAFRTILPEEAEQAADIEEICFPPNEACPRDVMRERVAKVPELFLVAVDKETGRIAGFLNGIATNEREFRDEFFTNARLHDPKGHTVMLCGLDVLPAYRNQGLARELVYQYGRREQEDGRARLVLTCLANKVKMYKRMGFRDLGQSASSWGGEKWHEMETFLQ